MQSALGNQFGLDVLNVGERKIITLSSSVPASTDLALGSAEIRGGSILRAAAASVDVSLVDAALIHLELGFGSNPAPAFGAVTSINRILPSHHDANYAQWFTPHPVVQYHWIPLNIRLPRNNGHLLLDISNGVALAVQLAVVLIVDPPAFPEAPNGSR